MRISLSIAKKELIETFRDKATFIMFIIPLLIFPAFNIGLDYLSNKKNTEINVCIQYDSKEAYDIFTQFVSYNTDYKINLIESEKYENLLKSGDADFGININGKNFDIIYNSTSYESMSLATELGEKFQAFYNELLSSMDKDIYHLSLKDEKGNSVSPFSSITNIFIPVVFILLIFQNTSSFSNDIFAGEKERKTLELLLMSGVKRSSIYFGKSIALMVLSVISLSTSLTAALVTYIPDKENFVQIKIMQSEKIYQNIFIMLFSMIILSALSVFISLSISMISKNIKSAQLLNEIILIIPVGITALLSLGIINLDLAVWDYVPILNLIKCFHSAFLGKTILANFLISLIINIFFALTIIVRSIKYLNSESILKA